MNGHSGLVVLRSREDLRLLGRDRGVLLDQWRGNTTHGFNTQRQRCDIQQQHVLHITRQHRALD